MRQAMTRYLLAFIALLVAGIVGCAKCQYCGTKDNLASAWVATNEPGRPDSCRCCTEKFESKDFYICSHCADSLAQLGEWDMRDFNNGLWHIHQTGKPTVFVWHGKCKKWGYENYIWQTWPFSHVGDSCITEVKP